jgi:hypothetical protein
MQEQNNLPFTFIYIMQMVAVNADIMAGKGIQIFIQPSRLGVFNGVIAGLYGRMC